MALTQSFLDDVIEIDGIRFVHAEHNDSDCFIALGEVDELDLKQAVYKYLTDGDMPLLDPEEAQEQICDMSTFTGTIKTEDTDDGWVCTADIDGEVVTQLV